jgi:type VI secretion system ImpM family protein
MQPVAFYGKRPEFEDYIRSDSFGGVYKRFQDWLDNSYDHLQTVLGAAFKDQFSVYRTLGIVTSFREHAQPIAALVTPSHDKSGRRFWFSIFTTVTEPCRQPVFLIADTYHEFFEFGHNCLAPDSGAFNGDRQATTLAQLGQVLPPDSTVAAGRFERFAGEYDLVKLSSLWHGNTDATGKSIASYLFATIPLKKGVPDTFRATFRFPLGGRIGDATLLISFWIALVDLTLPGALDKCTVYFTSDFLDLSFSQIEEHSLATALLLDDRNEQLWDFRGMALSGASVDDTLREGINRSVSDDNQSLQQLLADLKQLVG